MARTKPTPSIPLGNTDAFTPSLAHTVRLRSRRMPVDTHLEPHSHQWAQLAYCASGNVQVSVSPEAAGAPQAPRAPRTSYIIPPSRAVWIAPGAVHAITVLEAAELRTLYLHNSLTPPNWQGCRVIVVSALLRELIAAMEASGNGDSSEREQWIARLVQDEITRAPTQALGVPLPDAERGDKRLRALCEAVLRAPAARATLAEWASDIGASERTVARLFREELDMSYQQWRQQAVLAHALPLLARGMPVAQVAQASGYASDSAFSAMFKAAMGQPPSQFQG